jgi:hypothetical protein
MILHRAIFQARFGKADDLVAHFKAEMEAAPPDMVAAMNPRILTDISGQFDTVVVEFTHESLAALEAVRKAMLERNAASSTTSNILALVESGRNEYYTIE